MSRSSRKMRQALQGNTMGAARVFNEVFNLYIYRERAHAHVVVYRVRRFNNASSPAGFSKNRFTHTPVKITRTAKLFQFYRLNGVILCALCCIYTRRSKKLCIFRRYTCHDVHVYIATILLVYLYLTYSCVNGVYMMCNCSSSSSDRGNWSCTARALHHCLLHIIITRAARSRSSACAAPLYT